MAMEYSVLYRTNGSNFQIDFETLKKAKEWLSGESNKEWAVIVKVSDGDIVSHYRKV